MRIPKRIYATQQAEIDDWYSAIDVDLSLGQAVTIRFLPIAIITGRSVFYYFCFAYPIYNYGKLNVHFFFK